METPVGHNIVISFNYEEFAQRSETAKHHDICHMKPEDKKQNKKKENGRKRERVRNKWRKKENTGFAEEERSRVLLKLYLGRCSIINPLQTKRRRLYLKTQSVPRCKHFSFRL